MESLPVIEERVPLGPFCTLKIGGPARYFARAAHAEQIPFLVEAARERNVPLHILGGGSNTVCTDGAIDRFVIKMEERGIRLLEESKNTLLVDAAAGTPWDELVEYVIARGASGAEALSAIPGTVGAAPVQNISAYGQEVKDCIESVCAYDTQKNSFADIPASACRFGYRTSIFKTGERGRFIIVSVRFRFPKESPRIPRHPDTERFFADAGIPHPSAEDIRRAIIAIRVRKLPDPAAIPSAGSFFTNPLVTPETFEALRKRFPGIPAISLDGGTREVFAGWLIDQCGLKGTWKGNAGVYEKNAVVLVGNGKTTCREMMALRDAIVQVVRERFGITLQMEPEVVE